MSEPFSLSSQRPLLDVNDAGFMGRAMALTVFLVGLAVVAVAAGAYVLFARY
jgi:hypothetical protein